MKETIKRILKEERNLIKESVPKKLPTNFLIKSFSIIGKWLGGSKHTIEDVETDGFVYEELKDFIEEKLSIHHEEVEYVIASFSLNYMSNGDWDLLKEIGLKEPTKTVWDITKQYGMSAWVTEVSSNQEGYLQSEMEHYAFTGDEGYEFQETDMDITDMWDEQFDADANN